MYIEVDAISLIKEPGVENLYTTRAANPPRKAQAFVGVSKLSFISQLQASIARPPSKAWEFIDAALSITFTPIELADAKIMGINVGNIKTLGIFKVIPVMDFSSI